MKHEYMLVLKQDAIVCAQLVQHLLVEVEELSYSQSVLVHWLNRHDVKQVKLILDLPEEELYVDRHPSLFPWEMKAYAERQKKRRFPSTEFMRYFYTKPVKLPWQSVSGELWLSGFNEDDMLLKLMDWLDDAEVMVQSVHSSMTLWQTMLLKTWFQGRSLLSRFEQQSLVLLVRVSQQEFRQLLFINGLLRTNRLVQIDARETDEQFKQLVQEINLLEKFAKAQKLLAQTASLHLFYMGQDTQDRHQAFSAFKQSNFASFVYEGHFTDMQSLTSDMKLTQLYDRVMLLTLSSASLKSDYRPKIVQQVENVKQAAIALWGLWLVAVFVLFGYGLAFMTHQYETEQSIQKLAQVKQSQQEYIARFMSYYDIPFLNQYTLNDIKAAVDAQEAIEHIQQQQQLMPVLLPLSQVLSQHHSISLLALSVAASGQTSASPAKGNSANKASDGRLSEMILSLVIEVNAQSRLAEKIEQVNRLVADLNAINPTRLTQAKLTKVPFSVESSQSLKFNLEDSVQKEVMLVPFELSLTIAYE